MMNSLTAISPMLSSGSLLNEPPFETSDELMLEELERRDGIYSFIFHELEAPKNLKNKNELEMPQKSKRNYRNISNRTCKSNFKRIELDTNDKPPEIITSASIPTTATKSVSTHTSHNGHNANENAAKLPVKTEILRYQQYLKTWYPPLPQSMASTAAATTASIKFLHSTSSIVGPPPFYLDKRQTNLYSYMMNCGVSVRPQPPRFSHITEPLVRNRRHALKECETYKQHNLNGSCTKNLHIPDLRSLFPHDPDVHAPFIKSGNVIGEAEVVGNCVKMESLEKSATTSTILPPCSEIK